MARHLLLGMFAPLGIVFGAPVTLLLRNLPPAAGRRLVGWLGHPLPRTISHPVGAAVLDIGGLYLLYLTPLLAATAAYPLINGLVHWHFFAAGCLFTWAIAGPDPAPHRPGMATRLVVLVVAAGLHATLAKLIYAHGLAVGPGVGIGQIREAALWMYYGGDLAELALLVALFAGWWRRGRSGRGQRQTAGHKKSPRAFGPRASIHH
jgi:putative membrane protein